MLLPTRLPGTKTIPTVSELKAIIPCTTISKEQIKQDDNYYKTKNKSDCYYYSFVFTIEKLTKMN